jgi:predicted PP-loop superfamily ATPase
LCPILKKLSKTLQPYDDVVPVIKELLSSKKGNDVRILEHLLPYVEYQFGKPIIRKDHRERPDGQRVANWDVDICILL